MLFVVGSARLELHLFIALESGNSDGSAEDCLGEGDLLRAVEVVSDAFKLLVLAHVDLYNEVAGLAVKRLVAAVFEPQQSAVIDGLGDPNIHFDFLLQDSSAIAGLADLRIAAIGAEVDTLVSEALLDSCEGLDGVNRHLDADITAKQLGVSGGAVRRISVGRGEI